MAERCSYCGEEGHSIQECPVWKEKEVAPATEREQLINRLRELISKLPVFRIKWADIDKMSISELKHTVEYVESQLKEVTTFTDPLLGQCRYQFFYLTNELYGGYSAKCEKGSISVSYASPVAVIDLAEKVKMTVHLAGDAWEEIGRKGYGEFVPPSEARALLKQLTEKRGVSVSQFSSSGKPKKYLVEWKDERGFPFEEEYETREEAERVVSNLLAEGIRATIREKNPKRVYLNPAEFPSLGSHSSSSKKKFEVTYLDAAGRKHTEQIEDDVRFYQERVGPEGLMIISIHKLEK